MRENPRGKNRKNDETGKLEEWRIVKMTMRENPQGKNRKNDDEGNPEK